MTPQGIEQLQNSLGSPAFLNTEAKRRKALESLTHLSDDEALTKARQFMMQGIVKVTLAHFTGTMLQQVGTGEVVDLDEEMREEICRTWPNLRLYKHEERTMQAAWRKLKGIPPLKKADIDRLAEVHPNIYGPQAKARQDIPEPGSIGRDKADIRRTMLLAPREDIAAGVAHARQVKAISPEPLPAQVDEWTDYARGIVYAAMERQGVFG